MGGSEKIPPYDPVLMLDIERFHVGVNAIEQLQSQADARDIDLEPPAELNTTLRKSVTVLLKVIPARQ